MGFEQVIPAVRAEVGSDLSFKACSWFSTYSIHHRRAERFRQGRCFLLGDAAHVHSPVGAQGMNTGLQDAYNLGWKLALVVNGGAGEALLDSFEAERVPVAQQLLNTTDRAFTRWSHPTAGPPGCYARRCWRTWWPSRCAASECASWPFAPSRKPASTTAAARCRKRRPT